MPRCWRSAFSWRWFWINVLMRTPRVPCHNGSWRCSRTHAGRALRWPSRASRATSSARFRPRKSRSPDPVDAMTWIRSSRSDKSPNLSLSWSRCAAEAGILTSPKDHWFHCPEKTVNACPSGRGSGMRLKISESLAVLPCSAFKAVSNPCAIPAPS